MYYVYVYCIFFYYVFCEDVLFVFLYVKDVNWKYMLYVYYNNNNNVIRDLINDLRLYWKWLIDLLKCDKYFEEFYWIWWYIKFS